MPEPSTQACRRLAEWMGALSLSADTANAFPQEKVLRTVLIAVDVGRRAGLDAGQLRAAFWTPMLRYLGCTGFSHEEGAVYGAGDDLATRNTMVLADEGAPLETVGRVLRGLAPTAPFWERVGAIGRILGDGHSFIDHAAAQCEAATMLSEMAGFSADLVGPLRQICERWDGKGQPLGLRGDAVDVAVRLYRLADVAEVVWHREGVAAATAQIRRRSGAQLDPQLCAVFLEHAPAILGAIGDGSVWERFLAAEPAPLALVDDARIDAVCRSIACFADLKCVWTNGHSLAVARLAERAAVFLGLPPEERVVLRRAALLHDVGRLAVPNAVWDKAGALSPTEWEQVRLHAYATERILALCPGLERVGALARATHERVDGSGYHRGVPRAILSQAALVLAAADVCAALHEPRPHRPAMDTAAAGRVMAEAVAAGRLDAEAVRAVLMAAGAADDEVRSANPAGLSDREVEVLVLLTRGRSNREIAKSLGISPKTVQHHVAHVYEKIGARSRAGAALFAAQRGLAGMGG